MTVNTKTKKHASKTRPPKETSASFQKKIASQKNTTGSRTSTSQKSTSGSRKSSSRKSLTRDDRKRQLRLRIGLAAAVILLLFFLYKSGSLPLQSGHAVNLTDSVTQYQKQVEYYCGEYSISAFSEVVLAIMQQESAGMVSDVMQASESPFNTLYANTPNSITDPDYSIQVGVETFAYCLREANCTSPRDTKALKLALQTYNYGNSYATWALDNYGGYSLENAQEFSETMKLRLGWSRYGDPEYVEHVLQYYRPGF